MSDQILRLGYDAALLALSQQNERLANLRNRAVSLLSAVTIATTVGASVGIVNSDSAKGAVIPEWAARIALGLAVAVGFMILAILSPVRKWHYRAALSAFVAAKDKSERDFFINAISGLHKCLADNEAVLNRRYVTFLAAILLVLLDLAVVSATALLIGR